MFTKRLEAACDSSDLGTMSHIARRLHSDMRILEILYLHTALERLVGRIVGSLGSVDFASQGDLRLKIFVIFWVCY